MQPHDESATDFESVVDNPQPIEPDEIVAGLLCDLSRGLSSEITTIDAAWPYLPLSMRAGILAMIEMATCDDEQARLCLSFRCHSTPALIEEGQEDVLGIDLHRRSAGRNPVLVHSVLIVVTPSAARLQP